MIEYEVTGEDYDSGGPQIIAYDGEDNNPDSDQRTGGDSGGGDDGDSGEGDDGSDGGEGDDPAGDDDDEDFPVIDKSPIPINKPNLPNGGKLPTLAQGPTAPQLTAGSPVPGSAPAASTSPVVAPALRPSVSDSMVVMAILALVLIVFFAER